MYPVYRSGFAGGGSKKWGSDDPGSVVCALLESEHSPAAPHSGALGAPRAGVEDVVDSAANIERKGAWVPMKRLSVYVLVETEDGTIVKDWLNSGEGDPVTYAVFSSRKRAVKWKQGLPATSPGTYRVEAAVLMYPGSVRI